jgi:hypothetical protein
MENNKFQIQCKFWKKVGGREKNDEEQGGKEDYRAREKGVRKTNEQRPKPRLKKGER